MALNMQGGSPRAKVWGDVHEDFPGNDPAERCMDLHNNAVGRQAATTIYNNNSIPPTARRDALIRAIVAATDLQASPGC